MKRTRPAEQLSLTLSIANSVTLQEDMARCEAYAADMAAENAKLVAQVAQLQKDNASLKRAGTKLQAERDAIAKARLHEKAHPLFAECVKLRQEIEVMRSQIFTRVWQHVQAFQRQPVGPSKDALTALLTVAHPDKWAQGQPATELAHELSVAINQMREGAVS